MATKLLGDGDLLKLLSPYPDARLDVMTYSFEGELGEIHTFLKARRAPTRILAHERFRSEANLLRADNKLLEIGLLAATHAKLVIVQSEKWSRAIVGSANFGATSWVELMVSLSDEDMVARAAKFFEEFWGVARRVTDFTKGASLEDARAVAELLGKDVAKKDATWQFTKGKKKRKTDAEQKAEEARLLALLDAAGAKVRGQASTA